LEAARALYAKAATLSPISEEPSRFAEAALGEGRLEIRLGRYPSALQAFERALPGVTGAERRLEIEAGLARAAVLSGRLDHAQQVADAALQSAEASQGGEADPAMRIPPAIVAKLSYVRALVDWYRGDFDSAEPRLMDALSAAREAKDLVEQAAIVTAQGLVAHRRADLPRAASFYAEALSLGQKAHDEGRVLTALQNLGVVRHELGQWTEALDTYRHALTLAEAQDARAKVTQIAGNLGNLWRYLGETERAAQVLERGYSLALSDGNHHLRALIANLRGDVESDRGELSLAQRHYEEALEVARERGFEPERLESALNLSRLLCERLDLEAARATLEPALPLAERHEGLAIQLGAVKAQLLRRRGQVSEAKAQIDVALAAVERLKNPDQRWPIFLEAALIARDGDDLGSAETWSREVRRVLQAQLDQVPGKHREAFSQRRDRRAAMRETAPFLVEKREAKQPRALGWSRLLEVHKRLAGEHNVQRLLEYIMDSAILLTGAERGFLLLDDESHKEGLEVKVARNLDQENIRNRHLKISRGIARRVISTGEPVVTIDAMEDERYREQLSVVDLRLRSILCLPMSLRGRVLGAIYLDNRFRTSAFADEDIDFMEAFADMAAIALDNARLLESLENQAKQMAAARKEIEALNERLAAELSRRTQELEDTKVAILEERRNLSQQYGFENIIGAATNMRKVFQIIDRLKNTDIAVLIEGESGTGKELVARAIHFAGSRKERPFVAVNCGAIPATLLESELFGHVRGAFTNATSDKKGLFEVAHTGTLFLDEIGEMPLEMQVKLLRVLQSGEIQKVGATKQVTVDVRIVAATNRKLEEEVREGRFREDLYYRLSVVPIVVPPLRERKDDIPLLVSHFLAANRKSGLGNVTGISKEALTLLQRYAWPGNVRQLETVMKNATVFAEGETLTASDLSSFPDIVGGAQSEVDTRGFSLSGRPLAELERMAIVATLKELNGNKKKTAELLGIDRRTLYNKLAAYGIAIDSELKVK
ncbi:MAG TPA: sigma 54-interacting transcriptional regulator, partial [Myxococcota bacterium]|nr:sigma 54-interacting transcriptional regulator [Myxococcota bacterium]